MDAAAVRQVIRRDPVRTLVQEHDPDLGRRDGDRRVCRSGGRVCPGAATLARVVEHVERDARHVHDAGIVFLIPIYRIMAALGLNNTPYALMIVYPVFQLPFATWLLMGYYRSIPEELEDAALIDGANRFQIFTRLILPLAKPALMAVTLFAITNAWNEFFYAYVLIRSDRLYTLAVGLYQMVFNDVFPLGEMMAACILMVVPVLFIYGYAQKFMTEGLTLGSVKG